MCHVLHYLSTTMALEITCTSLLNSAEPFQSSGKLVPLTIFDRANFVGHVITIFAFPSPTPSNEELKHGLSQIIPYFPHVAGRLTLDSKQQLCISLNNAGVHIVEARVSSTLHESIPHAGTFKNLDALYPSIDEGIEELMQVQLNRYTCGGLVIAVTAEHYLGDGHSFSNFLSAWAQAVSAPDMPIPVTPFLDRGATAVPRTIPMSSFDHAKIDLKKRSFNSKFYSSNNVENIMVHFSADFISNLKALVPGGCTKFECLLSHMWKKVTAARRVKDTEFTEVKLGVNCRGRVEPAVPNLFGNFCLWAYPRLCVKDLLMSSHEQVVRVIRKAVARVDDAYIKSFIDFWAIASEKGEELSSTYAPPGTGLSPDLEVDSWLGFHFCDLDFGYGPPCAFITPTILNEGAMVFAPSCTEPGGVDVFLALWEDHIDAFRQICYSIHD